MLYYLLYSAAPLALTVTCIIHAVRNGHTMPWLYVLIFLPLAGAIAYIFVVIVPEMMSARDVQRLHSAARAMADPNKGLREAERNAEMIGSVDSRRILAEEYAARGRRREAIAIYDDLLQGHFADDPVLWLGRARVQFDDGDGAGAQASLDRLQEIDPKFQSSEAHMIYARALEMQGKAGEALAEYERLVRYFPGEEARCRFAALLAATGQKARANDIYAAVLKSLDGAPKHYRRAQKEWGDIAKAALAGAR